jgi:hypothetical protein
MVPLAGLMAMVQLALEVVTAAALRFAELRMAAKQACWSLERAAARKVALAARRPAGVP